MDLQHYIDVLKRRALPILIVTALSMVVVILVGLFTDPLYKASTTVRVMQDLGVRDLRLGTTYGEQLMKTYSGILTSWPLLQEASKRTGRNISPENLRAKVTVEVVADTELMRISVEDKSPIAARDLANTLAELLTEYAKNLYTSGDQSALDILGEQLVEVEGELEADREQLAALLASGKSDVEIDTLRKQIQFTEETYNQLLEYYELARLNDALQANSIAIIAPAVLPTSPSNGLGLTQVGLSLGIGLFGGLGLAMVLENLDTRIHSPHQLERLTHLPVLSNVPRGFLSLTNEPGANGYTLPIEEAYRLLGINLQSLREDAPFQTLLITSPMSKEGKSTVASNLAQTIAERGQTVFLVEGDLRRPALEKIFGIDNGHVGLSTLLTDRDTPINRTTLGEAIHPAEKSSLFILGSGPKPSNPTTLLASPSMKELVHCLGTQGHMTLLDAPPVLGMADVSVLVPHVDAVLLVVRQSQSKRDQILAALKQLQASRARVLGFVFLQKSDKDWGYA